jgi:hypothetical protein
VRVRGKWRRRWGPEEFGLGAESPEVGEDAVELAVEHGLVSEEDVEVVRDGEGACQGPVALVEGVADGAELEALGAAESPVGGGEARDEHLLDDAAGLDFAAEIGDEGVEVVGVLGAVAAENDDLAGEQAVLESVAGGAGLAFGGTRSGGPASVLAVGLKLFFGNAFRHGNPPVRGEEKAPSMGNNMPGDRLTTRGKRSRRNAKTKKRGNEETQEGRNGGGIGARRAGLCYGPRVVLTRAKAGWASDGAKRYPERAYVKCRELTPSARVDPQRMSSVEMFSGFARAVFEFSFTGSSSYFTGSFDSAKFALVTRSERHRLGAGQ